MTFIYLLKGWIRGRRLALATRVALIRLRRARLKSRDRLDYFDSAQDIRRRGVG